MKKQKKNKEKFTAYDICKKVLLVLVVISLCIHSAQWAANISYDKSYNVSTLQELKDAISDATANGGNNKIILEADIENVGGLTFSGADTVYTIVGNGHTLSGIGTMSVSSSATLNLGDPDENNNTLTIKGIKNNDLPGIVEILTSGICNMYSGTTLRDHIGNNYFGAGVTVRGGTFNMYGGTITNCGISGGSVCYGGGVAVHAGGIFNMNDGTISNCFVNTDYGEGLSISAIGGGVFVSQGSYFKMNGGTITNNEASYGGGIGVGYSLGEYYKSGWGYLGSKVEINGGTINGNKALKDGGGIYASGNKYVAAETMAAAPVGIGTQTKTGIVVDNAVIDQNSAGESGGGVYFHSIRSTCDMQLKNTTISNNEAKTGGGVSVEKYWINLKVNNSTITENSSAKNGGGLYLPGETVVDIVDSTITQNNSGEIGAGVYYNNSKGKVNLSGKNIIQENKYDEKENNLNIYEGTTILPVYIKGDLTGSKIGLSDPRLWNDGLTDNDENAISFEYLTSGYDATNGTKPNNNPYQYFTSDHATWVADYGADETETTGRDYSSEARLVRLNYTLHHNDGTEDRTTYYDIENPTNLPVLQHQGIKKFRGWYKEEDFSGDKQEKTPTTNVGNVDYYAKWVDMDDYAINYELDDGINSENNPDSYNDQSPTIIFEEPTKEHFTFKGWYEDEDFTTKITELPEGSEGDITLYAKWEADKYKVILHPNEGEIEEGYDVTEYSYDEETNLPDKTKIIREGYEFKGWYEDEDFSGEPVTKIEKFQTGDKEYFAKWEIAKYKVILHPNKGAIEHGYDVTEYSYNEETELPDENHITKQWYEFKGWYENEDFSGEPVTKIEKFQTGDKEFYAKWEKIEEPSDEPTDEPGDEPTEEPGDEPTDEPGDEPTDEPGDEPTDEPGDEPTDKPVEKPIEKPIDKPIQKPNDVQVDEPESKPTENKPEEKPTKPNTENTNKKPENEVVENVKTGDTIVKYIDILIICVGLYMITFKIKTRKRKH